MGGLSIWHLIIILMFLAATAGLVGLVVWISARSSRKRVIQATSDDMGSESSLVATVEARLLHLDDLWAKGVITESEYEQQRAAIIKRI